MVPLLQLALASKEIQPVHPKGDQHWIFTGRNDAEAPILWPPHAKSQLIGKDLNAGKVWGQEEKGLTEDEMVEWHHWLNGHEFEKTAGDSEGQGSLVCYNPWGHTELDRTEKLSTDFSLESGNLKGGRPYPSDCRALHQAPLSMGFSRNAGGDFHFHLQGFLPTQGMNPNLLLGR